MAPRFSFPVVVALACIIGVGTSPRVDSQAPLFIAPTSCPQVVTVQVGNAVSFPVTAAANSGAAVETIILNSGGIPAGSSFTPALPLLASGANITTSSTFDWTPTLADVGPHAIILFAVNELSNLTQCTVLIDVVISTLPVFVTPTPCGQTLTANVGVPFAFTVSAVAPGVVLALASGPLPGTSTHNPALPMLVTGAQYPVATSNFNWTPVQNDVGTHFIVYVATNQFGQSTFCGVQVNVAECLILLGTSPGNYLYSGLDRILVNPTYWMVVSLTDIPSLYIPPFPQYQGMHLYAQVGMYNPSVFPNDPLQLSHGLDITIGSGAVNYGNGGSGMTLWLTQPPLIGSVLTFHFHIPGI